MTKQTRKEMETVISKCGSDKVWTAFSDDPKFVRKFEAAGAKVVRRTGDGKTFELELSQISFRTKKGFKFDGESSADNVKAVGLSQEERETHINIAADGSEWEIYTSIPSMMNKMEKVGATFVKDFSFGKIYRLDMNQVSIRQKQTAEQKAVKSANAKRNFAKQEVEIAA